MPKLKTLISVIKKPYNIIQILKNYQLLNWVPDKIYLKIIYKIETGKKLNIKNPISFNEKIQWLKLYHYNPNYTKYVDKYEVRYHVKKTLGEEYLIPLIDVYNSVDEIKWEELPNKFILKCTHGSGTNIICLDKTNLDIQETKKKLKKWMNTNWFWFGREWVYKEVKPRIICEQLMVDESGKELKDYKFFCFNGKVNTIQVDFNRFENHQRNLYDINWKFIDKVIEYPNNPNIQIKKPKQLEKMLFFAKKLSKGIPHARIDFYSINSQIYFGEITFFHGSGFEKFIPEEFGLEMGSRIIIP